MRIEFKNIVCATDLSDFSDITVRYGIALARAFEASVQPCHIIQLPTITTHYGTIYLDPNEEQDRLFAFVQEHFEELFQGTDVPWEPIIAIGNVPDEIERVSQRSDVDLIVTATHGRSGFKRLLLGSVTERLMRSVSCPLLIVGRDEPDMARLSEVPFKFRRILVGCDFSRDAALALDYGLRLAQEFEALIHLVHVVEPPMYIDMVNAAFETGLTTVNDLKKRIRDKLESLIPEEASHWCDVRIEVLDGQAHSEIPAYAQVHGIDLIVLGARGYGLVEKLLVGSTTDRVARRATCPVLSVSPKSKPVVAAGEAPAAS